MPTELITQVQIPLGTEPYSSREPARMVGMTGNQLPKFPSQTSAQTFVDQMKDQGHAATPLRPLLVLRTDLNRIMSYDGSAWSTPSQVVGSYQADGAPIVFPPLSLPQGTPLIIKSGRVAGYTGKRIYNNGYMPETRFSTPFPNACLNVQVTQISSSLAGYTFNVLDKIPTVDIVDREKFRVFFPNDAGEQPHAFAWLALGY